MPQHPVDLILAGAGASRVLGPSWGAAFAVHAGLGVLPAETEGCPQCSTHRCVPEACCAVLCKMMHVHYIARGSAAVCKPWPQFAKLVYILLGLHCFSAT